MGDEVIQLGKSSLISISLAIALITMAFWGGYELGRVKTDMAALESTLQDVENDLNDLSGRVRTMQSDILYLKIRHQKQ